MRRKERLMRIGENIKYFRKLHHLTQSETAELSGINEKYLGRIERNESVPTLDKIEQLCIAFDVRINDLLMIEPDRKTSVISVEKAVNVPCSERELFYCNCCGCYFEAGKEEDIDIICPECMCIFDESNNYIERFNKYSVVLAYEDSL